MRYASLIGSGEAVFHCAHRATVIHPIDPSKLAYFSSLGRAPMLVYVQPSNEALLIPYTSFQGNGLAVLHCAHRTSTVSSCAFC